MEGFGARKYYVLNQELRREKTNWGETDGEMFIVNYSTVNCACSM